MRSLLRRERELRLSDETQHLYEEAERSANSDWMEVTLRLQRRVLREAGLGDGPGNLRALQTAALRFPELAEEALQVRFNRAGRGTLRVGDPAPDCPLSGTTVSALASAASPRALVLVAGSYS